MTENKENINIWLPFALSIMLAMGMFFGYQMNDKDVGPLISSFDDQFDEVGIGQVEELIRFVESKYVDSIERAPMVSAAIEAVLNELDPHSVYISPDQLVRVNQEMEGSFNGIGIESYFLEDTVRIINVIDNGPAAKVGVAPFDKLVKIDETNVAGQGLEFSEIEEKLKGEVGKKLNLTFLDKNGNIKSKELVIGEIPLKSIDVSLNLSKEVGYIKINRFSSKTYKEFMDHFETMQENGTKHLVIDLRGNPGGYLPEATNILSQLFSEKGKVLVYTEGKTDKKIEYKTTGKPFFQVDKIAVLIDEGSASGSEIIAGAIQEWDRGVIIGRRSFGKGLVQEQYDLQNGGALRITVARYYTPSGRSIQRVYNDLEAYDNDLYERIHGGELFNSDSINQENNILYKTMLLERPVIGSGGITPDVFIPLDSSSLDYSYIDAYKQVNKFVFSHLGKNKIDKFDEKLVSSLWSTFNTETTEQLSTKVKKRLRNDIRYSLLEYLEGEGESYKSKLEQDPFIKLSMKYINEDLNLEDL